METKKIVVGGLFLIGLHSYCQNTKHDDNKYCEKEIQWTCGTPVSGVVRNIHFQNCNQDILITVGNENERTTEISGIIETSKKVRIVPAYGKKIRLLPLEKHCSEDDEDNHDDHRNAQKKHRSTSIGKEEEAENTFELDIQEKETVLLYPNPVENELKIETQKEVLNFKIVNSLGLTNLEGTFSNRKIKVDFLPKGLYNLIIQTKTQIITKTFYKN